MNLIETIGMLGITLIIAVGFLLYYSYRAVHLLKGGEGWRYLTIGYLFYAVRVFFVLFRRRGNI